MPLSNPNHSISSLIENNFQSETNTALLDSKTILLIDDEEMVVKITEAMLKKIGCKILKAANGYEGLKLFQRHRDSIDIVICDMIMAKMDGLQLVHKLREIDPCVKVLLSSGSLIDEDEKDVANRGFDGLIKKPYKLNDLSEKIGNILR